MNHKLQPNKIDDSLNVSSDALLKCLYFVDIKNPKNIGVYKRSLYLKYIMLHIYTFNATLVFLRNAVHTLHKLNLP